MFSSSVQDSVWWCEDGTGWCWVWPQPWRLMNLLHRPVRMRIASVGVSKFCFLFSLAFCGLLLLLIPAFQPPARQVDLPQPRPQIRPTHAGSSHHTRVPAVAVHAGGADTDTGLNGSSLGQGETTEMEVTGGDKRRVDSPKSLERGAFPARKAGGPLGSTSHDPLALKDIFIAVKTTKKYHKSRLELLIHTWVSQAKEHVSRAAVIYSCGCSFNSTVLFIRLDYPKGSIPFNM